MMPTNQRQFQLQRCLILWPPRNSRSSSSFFLTLSSSLSSIICKRRFHWHHCFHKNSASFIVGYHFNYFSAAAANHNNHDGDGQESESGRTGTNTKNNSKQEVANLRPRASSIPRGITQNNNHRNHESSFDDYHKLRGLESFITVDHRIRTSPSSSKSSSSSSPSPPQSQYNKRLSSIPPSHWSIPQQYINATKNKSPYNRIVPPRQRPPPPRGNNINIKTRIYASRSMAQLLDIVYLENCRREDAESEASSSTTVTMMQPHTLIIFWEKLSSLVKEHCLGRRDTSTISYSSEAEVHQEDELLNYRLEKILNDTILALPQYHPGQIRNIAFAVATIVKDIGGINHAASKINDRRGNRRNGDASGRQGNTMHVVDLRMILYNQLVTSRNATVFWDMMQEQLLLQSMDNYRPKWLVSIAWSLATMSESIRKHHHQQQQQQQHHRSRHYSSNHRNQSNDTHMPTATLDVTPFYDALPLTFHKRRMEFSSKQLGNLAWSTMTCRANNTNNHSPILRDFANEFISRRRMSLLNEDDGRNEWEKRGGLVYDEEDGIDPMTLCQWASSYAKAGYNDEELFHAIASTAIPLLNEQKFDMRYLANLAYAFALADLTPSPNLTSLFDSIAVASMEKLPSFTTQNFANLVWAYAKVEHSSPTLFESVAREAIPRLLEFSSQELANLAWAFAKFHPSTHHSKSSSVSPAASSPSPSDVIFDHIAEEVLTRGLSSFTLQGVAMLAHSFATVGHHNTTNTRVWNIIDNAIRTRQRELGYLECSHIARSYAMIGRKSDDLFRSIESFVLSSNNLQQFKPPGLSSLAWAYATLGYDVPHLYSAIATQCIQCLNEFNRVDEVMLVLALSRIDLPLPEIRDRIFARTTSHLSEYMGLDLFNMLVFYVRAGYKSDHWMEAMAREIISRSPSTFSPDMVVGIAHSYASVGCRNPALCNYLLSICVNSLAELEPKELASLAWSFATMEFFDRKFFCMLADSCDGRWQEFEAASLATMAWAYATAREDRPVLFKGIMDAAKDRVDDFSAQGVSMLLWACSTAGHLDQRLFRSFEATTEKLLHECDSQTLANIAWAYTVANIDPDTLFGPTSKFIDIVSEKFDAFNGQGLCQLHQWNIWRKYIGSDSTLPPHIEKRCYDVFRNQPTRLSKLQDSVISELISMGILIEEESCTHNGFSLDALVDVDGNKIAVEVDGPHHFVGANLTGNSTLKHRQVATMEGIPVVSLPYWEWTNLKTSDDKQEYLRNKLGLSKTQ